jgi:hypothetical protein
MGSQPVIAVVSMTEQQLLDCVCDLCDVFHLRYCHFRTARTVRGWVTAIQGNKGFPDLVVAGARGVMYRELKSATGKPTLDQREWLALLGGAVWRPDDWLSGRIERELRAIAGYPNAHRQKVNQQGC